MKWRSRKSPLKRWINRKRQHSYSGDSHVVLPLLPKKVGYGEGASVYWFSPVTRTWKNHSWKPSWLLDPGHASWWSYEIPYNRSDIWKEWARTRPIHHLAGLIYFLVYWGWCPAILAGIFWFLLRAP